MDIYTGLEKFIFRTDDAGNTVYYPWGMRRTGVIVPSREELETIKKRTRKFYNILPYIMLFSVFVIALFGDSLIKVLIFCLPGIFYFAIFGIITRISVKNYQKSTKKFTYVELWKINTEDQSFQKIGAIGILSLVFLVYATYITATENNYIFGFIAIPVSAFFIIASCVMIYIKLINR